MEQKNKPKDEKTGFGSAVNFATVFGLFWTVLFAIVGAVCAITGGKDPLFDFDFADTGVGGVLLYSLIVFAVSFVLGIMLYAIFSNTGDLE